MDVVGHNRAFWDGRVEAGHRWTLTVDAEEVERARRGEFSLLLTPTKAVPREWFGELKGTRTLCLASGGGQQGPLLAAAGAAVTVFDSSPRQLGQDRIVAEREGLAIETVQGDMSDLSAFADGSFDLIVHPVSNCFAAEIRGVWRECFRVLRRGGILLSGFNNPVRFIFEDEKAQNGSLEVRYSIPYSDLTSLSAADRERLIIRGKRAVEFGHSLTDQIGGQLDAGFLLSGFYEDGYGAAANDAISRYMETFIATRAVKP